MTATNNKKFWLYLSRYFLSLSLLIIALTIMPVIAFAEVDLSTLELAPSPDVSAQASYKSFNRRTSESNYSVILTNLSSNPILGDIYFVVDTISSPDVDINNAEEISTGGKSILIFANSSLAPNDTLTKPLIFTNPTRTRFSFTHEIYLTPDVIEQLAIKITSPVGGLVTKESTLAVTGSISGANAVVVNGIQGVIQNNFFTASIALLEGTTTLVATATTENGDTVSDSVTVRLDTTAPLVVIESPKNGDRLVTDSVAVAGTVNDIIPGATVNADDVSVVINGFPAEVSNRTFFIPELPLIEGVNTLEATATDKAGNSKTSSIQISYEPDLTGVRISLESGNAQSAEINALLPQSLVVKVANKEGGVLAGRAVTFEVTRGDGLLNDPLNNLRSVTLLTDTAGLASINFNLGSRTGRGLHRIKATSPGSLSFAEFCATALNTPPANIAINRMPSHKGIIDQTLTDPLSVIVTDSGGNPVDQVPVTFAVDFGGGDFYGQLNKTVLTNPDGIAEAFWTIGPNAGVDSNIALVTFPDNQGFSATFTATGIATGDIAQTTVSGIVQNNSGNPIVGIRAVITGTNLEGLTGADGQFVIANVPPGGHHVAVQGSSINNPDANIYYPDIEFAVEVFPGAENSLDQIVVLPFLDMGGAKIVGGSQDVVLGMAGVPGFSVKIFANSVILKDGSRGQIEMSSSQVKFDKIPMPPPQGATPLIVGTLQPGGIRFDPPAQVTYPNVNGLAPGDVADIFAFHHDIGQFVNIGPGTVSEDGTVITSDPGFGIVQSGWHGVIRIPGPTSQAANGCSATAEVEGKLISPANPFILVEGDTKTVKVTFNPSGTLEGSWSSANAAIATATGGSSLTATVTGVAPGKVTVTSPTNRITLTEEQGGDKTCVVEVEGNVIDISLKTVSFFGVAGNIKSDDGVNTFSAPHWVDNDLDGKAEKKHPVVFVRASTTSLAAEFIINPPPTGKIKIRATGPKSGTNSLTIPSTVGTVTANGVKLDKRTVSNPFMNKVDVFDKFEFKWEISIDDGPWINAGSSSNIAYVTWDKPKQVSPIHTLVRIGTLAADEVMGKIGTNDNDVLNKVWSRIKSKSISRASDNVILSYYGFFDVNGNGSWDDVIDTNFNNTLTCKVTNAEGLIKNGNGQCLSWATFMHEVLAAQGLSKVNGVFNKAISVKIKPPNGAFAVKNWKKTGVSPRVVIDTDAGVDGGMPATLDASKDQAADDKGAAGQGNSPNPPSGFINHWIIKTNGKYYDPSYGLGPFDDLKKYEDSAFDGTMTKIGSNIVLEDLPNDNKDASDKSDEVNNYSDFPF